MAQKKKTQTNRSKGSVKKKTQKKNNYANTFFNSDHKQAISFICFFASLFFIAVVFIDAGGLWGALRNFFFGVFGLTAFIIPVFTAVVSLIAAIGKDTREYKIKVTEGFILFTLAVSFMHIVATNAEHTYGEQIADAYNVFKSYSGDGMHYGYGVFGAVIGGLPLILTGGSKVAAGIIVALLLICLTMFFTGVTLSNIFNTFKKTADAVGEYTGEKIDNFKESREEAQEAKAERQSKAAERRRKKSEVHTIDLDIPLDDEVYEDVGVDPILSDDNDFDDTVDVDDVIALFENPDGISDESSFVDKTEDVFDDNNEDLIFDVDLETGEVVENEDIDDGATSDEIDDVSEQPVVPEVIYELPAVDLLDKPKNSSKAGNGNELREKGETIVKTLKSFGVGTHIVEICQSPSVTRFELQPDPGVKISKITALADDIAMNLAASGVRIEAPIPNKNAVGIEVPNAEKAMVTLREIIETDTYKNAKSKINVALGRDIQGECTCADLAKMPHLLVAGTTGSGKSVCLNTMIMSLLYNATPDEVKLIMIDPKKVEFTVYKALPHLLIPVVTDPRKAAGALSWAVAEMDKRYALFSDNRVRNLQGYNTYAVSNGLPKLPQIVIIIDELSDLMMAASNEVEDSICRLAQKARAAGMHLIVATQRPSVDVITGLIKANIPSRIAFAVKSQIDSRTIIDTQGAEKLLGNGDMLYCPVGLSKPVRVQGCYVSDDEIERVIEFVTSQGSAKYDDSVMQEIELKAAAQGGKKKSSAEVEVDTPSNGYDDDMTEKAIEVVVEAGMASTTLIQRKLKLGYARAARIVDELSEKGVIGPFEGAKPRKVLITKDQWLEMQANSSSTAPKQLSVDDLPTEKPQQAPVAQTISTDNNYFGSAINTDDDEDDF